MNECKKGFLENELDKTANQISEKIFGVFDLNEIGNDVGRELIYSIKDILVLNLPEIIEKMERTISKRYPLYKVESHMIDESGYHWYVFGDKNDLKYGDILQNCRTAEVVRIIWIPNSDDYDSSIFKGIPEGAIRVNGNMEDELGRVAGCVAIGDVMSKQGNTEEE